MQCLRLDVAVNYPLRDDSSQFCSVGSKSLSVSRQPGLTIIDGDERAVPELTKRSVSRT